MSYKTEAGARVGDILMSVIETCALNGINVWEYLLAVVRHERAVGRDPARWLPWEVGWTQSRRQAA